MTPMAHEFTYRRRVEFADTDAAGVCHFASFFRFMEEAEHAFYRSLGTVAYREAGGRIEGMPRVAVSCEYLAPARYADELDVRLVVREKTAKAIQYDVSFAAARSGERVVLARGTMRVVYVEREAGAEDWRAAGLPPALREAIDVAPEAPRDPV